MLKSLKRKIFGRGPVLTRGNILTTVALLVFGVFSATAVFGAILYCLVGGIVATIEGFKATPIDSSMVAFGVVRILLTGVVFQVVFWGGVFLSNFIARRA